MTERVTEADLLKRCYARTHEAADQVSELDNKGVAAVTVAEITKLRNVLREALSAAQELKTRIKNQQLKKEK